MTPVVERTPQAKIDLAEIATYLFENQSERLAVRFALAADATFQKLALMPTLGQEYESQHSYEGETLRIWQVKGFSKYLIIYRVIENGIVVLRVIHGNRRWEQLL